MKQLFSPKGLYHLLLEALLGSLGVLGSVLCLSTAFSIPLPLLTWILVPVLILAVGLLAKQQRGRLFCAIAGSLLLLAALLFLRPLGRCFLNLARLLLQQYAKGYDDLRNYFNPSLPVNPVSAGRALLIIAVAESYVTALALCRWKRTAPAAAAMLLGVVPCFVLIDTPPSLYALLLVAVSILIQMFSQNVRRREPKETGKAVLWATLLTGLLLTALVLIFPRSTYKPPFTWQQLSNWIQQWNTKRDNRGNELAGLTGNPDAVHLEDLRSLPNSPMQVMEVQTDYRGRLYLRGSAYSGFDGSNWSRDTETDWPLDAIYLSLGQEPGQGYRLTVKPISGESLFYTTYDPLTLPTGSVLQGDAYLYNPSPKAEYSLDFLPEAALGQPVNQSYDRYVYETCLDLPAETRAGLRDWFVEHAGTGSLSLEPAVQAELVSDLVSQAAVYSREASYPPAGQDFSLWFLEEAETGYCVHYATAAAAMLRALSIPSRYVSGYICTPDSSGHATVTTLQAHAWVEYYAGGIWHRLEPTPGEATEFTGRLPAQEIPSEPETASQQPTLQITEPAEPSTEPPVLPVTEAPTEPTQPRTSESEETQPANPPREPDAPNPTEAPDGPGTSREPWRFPGWLWIPLGLLALMGVLILRRRLARLLRDRKLSRCDGNGQAVLMFRRCRRLCHLLGEEPDDQALELAKKAGFSQHALTPEELSFLRQTLDRTVSRLDRSGLPKRLWYRYILAVI